MKTTLDLPDELVRAMKLRAVNEGRKLKEVAAELIAHGLKPRPLSSRKIHQVVPRRLPTIQGRPVKSPNKGDARSLAELIQTTELEAEQSRYENAFRR